MALINGVLEKNQQRGNKMKIPKTIDEAIEYLLNKMHITNKNYIKNLKEENLISMHHTFGRQIRNDFELWHNNKELIKNITGDEYSHPDEVSMIIIKTFWEKLKEKNEKK